MRSREDIIATIDSEQDNVDFTYTEPCWRTDNEQRHAQLEVLLDIRDLLVKLVKKGEKE